MVLGFIFFRWVNAWCCRCAVRWFQSESRIGPMFSDIRKRVQAASCQPWHALSHAMATRVALVA
jgi:hypothetical protein